VIDSVLPAYDWRSAHACTVAAPPERVDAALRAVRWGDLRVTGALMTLRSLGRRRAGDRTLVETMTGIGLRPLVDEPGILVLAGIGQPWKPMGGRRPPWDGSLEGYRAFAEPGSVRMVAGFAVAPAPAGSRLSTETRVAATDETARRRFGRYWRLIAPFSGLTRREMLAAVRRRAEAGG